jgi:peptide/nickel transport system permease protein
MANAPVVVDPQPREPRARRRRLGRAQTVFGAVFVVIVLAVVVGPTLLPYGYREVVGLPGQLPSSAHWLGTDEVGRDVFARLVYAGQTTLLIGALSSVVAAVIGIPWGFVGGYYGKVVDAVSMRLTDALLAFPDIVLALVLVAILGPSVTNLVIAIGVVQIPRFARLIRGTVLALREEEFVDASRAAGGTDVHILREAILPNLYGIAAVQFSLTFATAVLTAAGLSFVGLGVQPPEPSWGGMLNSARFLLDRNPVYGIAAGAAISLTVLSLTFIGDALTKAADPRQARL